MSQNRRLKPFGEIPESFTALKDKGIYYTDKTGFIPYLNGRMASRSFRYLES